jgi:Mrp family chromosome partitioning ATPase
MEHFVVLPAGPAFNGSTDLLGSPRMKELVMELKSRYPDRYVMFDCPCLLGTPDSLVFSSYVDAVVLVVEAGRTKREDIAASLDLLSDRNVVGVVMNKVDAK